MRLCLALSESAKPHVDISVAFLLKIFSVALRRITPCLTRLFLVQGLPLALCSLRPSPPLQLRRLQRVSSVPCQAEFFLVLSSSFASNDDIQNHA